MCHPVIGPLIHLVQPDVIPPLGRKFHFFLGTGTSVREDLVWVPICETDFTSLFCQLQVDKLHCTDRSPSLCEPQRTEWRITNLFLSVNKKPNYYNRIKEDESRGIEMSH